MQASFALAPTLHPLTLTEQASFLYPSMYACLLPVESDFA